MTLEAQDQSVSAEALKAAETAVREAVTKHGQQHPEVLERLEQYVALLRKAGNDSQAEKLAEKAKLLRQSMTATAAGQTNPAEGQAPAVSPESSPPPAPAAEPAADPAPAAESTVAPAAQDMGSTAEKHLFNSRGEHIATASQGYIFTPSGVSLGRWIEDLNVFVDKDGWYLGVVIDEDRLARESNWTYSHVNFGNKGNEGDQTGWGRQPDTNRTILPIGFEDVPIG